MKLTRALSRGITEIYSLKHLLAPARGLRILVYHAVGTKLDFDDLGLSMDPGLFGAHMTWLKSHDAFKITSLDLNALNDWKGTQVAVTFDDGYRDNLTVAAPILTELKIPFTVFVVPSYVQSGNPYYLTVSQLKELAAVPGCRIGSHGMNHKALTGLNPTELAAELKDSRRWLEDSLAQPVTMISYPYGLANRAVREAAAEAGYLLGACSRTQTNDASRDPLMLCRTEIVADDGLRSFKKKTSGGWDWHRLRRHDPAL